MQLTEKTFDTEELMLAYLENEASDAPPIVLLHGLTGWRSDWKNFAPLLTPDWHVYVLELRGHGNSGRGESYRLVDYDRDVVAFLKHLNQPVVLVGFSLGALIALTVASQFPAGIRTLILIDPPLFAGTSNAGQEVGGYFSWVYETIKAKPSYETLLAQCAVMFPPEMGEVALKAMADQLSRVAPGTVGTVLQGQLWNSADLFPALQSIQPPTMMMYGDWTMGAVVSDQAVELFKRTLPSASVVKVPDVGHLIPIERPNAVLQHLDDFLASVG